MSNIKFKIEKTYEEYIVLFKSVCEESNKVLSVRELRDNKDLPSENYFINYCPDKNVKKYNDFLEWIGLNPNLKPTRYNYQMAYEEFAKRGFILLPQDFISSALPLKYICPKHPNIIQTKTLNNLIFGRNSENQMCHYCYLESIHGEGSPVWKGGISSLNAYLREFIKEWKKKSMENCNYKCVITGDKFDVIHHLYSFNKILQEILIELNMPIYSTINEYTTEELELLQIKIEQKHKEYPLGVCLSKNIHNLYHRLYGDDNTPEQFEEFKDRYNNGEFDEILKVA